MSAARARPFTLIPFEPAPAVLGISGEVIRTADGLRVSFRLAADPAGLQLPPACPPRFADELWRHTCCELFVTRRGVPGYYEFNFSPSGEFAVYAFAGYREPVALPLAPDPAAFDPAIAVSVDAQGVRLTAEARIDRCWPDVIAADLRLALSAVIETRTGALSYWALTHPGPRPDFHHPDAFTLESP